ncbi:hypothetical protein AJ88_36900 [Mesorhizobium amorphae CCBAU 01583]|nr:hypothetical protein AJ88_36900 [Mesorhizobium amorphae CCBAU 01583]
MDDASGHHGILAVRGPFAGIVGHAAQPLRRQVLDVDRFCRKIVEADDLAGIDRLESSCDL